MRDVREQQDVIARAAQLTREAAVDRGNRRLLEVEAAELLKARFAAARLRNAQLAGGEPR